MGQKRMWQTAISMLATALLVVAGGELQVAASKPTSTGNPTVTIKLTPAAWQEMVSVAISPDQQTLVGGFTNRGGRENLKIWQLDSGELLHEPVADRNTEATPALLLAQRKSCSVVNIRTGQLALRFSPNGKSRAGLDNGNTVELLKDGPGVWRYIRVLNGPNSRVNGLEGWVNSNYLACGGVDDSGDFVNVLVFAPPSNVRTSPNGSVVCTIAKQQVIRVYVEPQGSWYSTTACGGGWIHESQIR